MTLNDVIAKINTNRKQSYQFLAALRLLGAVIVGSLAASLASWGGIDAATHLLFVLILGFSGTIVVTWPRRKQAVSAHSLLLGIEIQYPNLQQSAMAIKNSATIPETDDWQHTIENIQAGYVDRDRKNIRKGLMDLMIPLALLVMVSTQTGNVLSQAWIGAKDVAAQFQWGVSLKIIQGQGNAEDPASFPLVPSSAKKITLLTQNMVRVTLRGRANQKHSVELWRSQDDGSASLFQSFQMAAADANEESGDRSALYSLEFSIGENVTLKIPSHSGNAALAIIEVKKLPVPQVWLSHETDTPKDPWPDDQPLKLNIRVKARNPLQQVRICIVADRKKSSEVVSNVLSDNKLSLSTDYELLLEPYLERDVSQVEVFAEAIDRALPEPLLGRSNVLRLTAASAYGRYQQTLNSLRQFKQVIDDSISDEKQTSLDNQADELIQQSLQQADDSPFFDGLDRMTLQQIAEQTAEVIQQQAAGEKLLNLSSAVNEFLFEHETLDDKERDRDFFVALRGLSRLIEQPRFQRPVTVAKVTERLRQFLDDRHQRWQLRIKRIPLDRQPTQWKRIEKRKPFHATLREVAQLDLKKTQTSDDAALQRISTLAVSYREWIEALESAEEKSRQEREQERQQGITNARNVLRELQKRQGSISGQLDRAKDQSQEELSANWNLIRMEQNTNIQETNSLEAQMRAFSPLAGERIKLASDFMSATLTSGNDREFVAAESNSDRAGRLLRQADSAARQSQQQKGSRGRRRRISGDGYYGQSVIGGDVEIRRDYQVDRRYREDVLEDVRRTSDALQDQENRALLENYLREIIR